jgi:hypothetical protein
MARLPFKRKREDPLDAPAPVEAREDTARPPESAPKPQETVVRPDPPFTADERIERGLLAVAAFNGNTRKAAEFLAGDDLEIPHQTLWSWANKVHVDRYEALRAERLPRVQAAAAERHLEMLDRNLDLEGKLLDDLDGKRHELAARDLSTAARNAAVGTGIHSQNHLLYSGQPTEIHKNRDASELLRLLKARAPGLFIEGTVVSEETLPPHSPEAEDEAPSP